MRFGYINVCEELAYITSNQCVCVVLKVKEDKVASFNAHRATRAGEKALRDGIFYKSAVLFL